MTGLPTVQTSHRRLRVGFDARALASPAAGVRRYAHLLFGTLARLERSPEVIAVGASTVQVLPAGVGRGPSSPSLPTNLGWMASGLPAAARKAQVDIFHAPSYTVPVRGPRPLVLTIHDVSYERHPAWYPYRRDPLRRAFYRWSARNADVVITDSMFSKQEIGAAYGLDGSQVAVIPLAAAPWFASGPALPLPPRVSTPYLLHVGDLHVRRNLVPLAMVLRHLIDRRVVPSNLTLVCAGADRGTASDVADALGGAARLVGAVSDETLLALYRSASALVYPSRYEGFGIPLLEAMACGIPVIASNAASIPEVVGDAGVLLDPDDADGWAAAITRIIADEQYVTWLRGLGYERAKQFSWTVTAEATRIVYQQVLERP